jgi:hypothetical protein
MSTPPPDQPFVLDQSHLRRARNLARESGSTVIAELERLHDGTPAELVRQLARLFGMAPIDLPAMRSLQPAIELLPVLMARRWGCLLLREADGALLGVLADPFDPDLQLWLNGQARGTVLMRLCSNLDLQTYLGQLSERRKNSPGSSVPAPSSLLSAPPLPTLKPLPLQISPEAELSGIALDATRDLLRRAMRR